MNYFSVIVVFPVQIDSASCLKIIIIIIPMSNDTFLNLIIKQIPFLCSF